MGDWWQFLFKPNGDPNLWLASRLLLACFGAIAAYLFKINFFDTPGETKGTFRHGFVFAFFGTIGGICFLNPPTAINAFAAGLSGVAIMASFSKETNKGASDKRYSGKILQPSEISKQAGESIKEEETNG